jgi:hypothetical protein
MRLPAREESESELPQLERQSLSVSFHSPQLTRESRIE